MPANTGSGDLPALREALPLATVDELRWYTAALPGGKGTRKAELVAHLLSVLGDPAAIARLWAQVPPAARLVIADTVHYGQGHYNGAAMQAKYPGAPVPMSSRIWYYDFDMRNQRATYFDLFFVYDREIGLFVPSEIAAVVRELAPPPPPTAIESQDAPPALEYTGQHGEAPADLVQIAETESVVFHDLAATLALVGEGKATVGASTRMPTLATLRNLRKRLLLGDYLEENYERAEDAIRPLALILLVQAARWAAAGGTTGTKLALTPEGQALLAGGVEARHVREAWQRWLKSDLLDELSRIRNIRGQQSTHVRLTRPAARRAKLAEALAACPRDRWVLFDDLLRYMLAEQLVPAIEANRDSGLYIGYYQDWGEGGFSGPYWDVIAGSYLRVVVWEYAATLGLIDLAYTRPEDAPHEFGEFYYLDMDYLSRYDGLLALRLTQLGAYVLGQDRTYQPATPRIPTGAPLLKILPNLDLVITDPPRALPNIRLLLSRMATAQSDAVYHLDRDVLLDALDQGYTLEQAQVFLANHSGTPPDAWPQTVQRFFADLAGRLTVLREAGPVALIEADDPLLLAELANTAGLRPLVTLAQAGDRAVLLVPQDQAATVRRLLKKLGYLPRRA